LNNTEAWFEISQKVGCGGQEVGASQSLACVRGKPFEEILGATVVTDPLQAITGNFGPTVDDRLVFADYEQRGKDGQFAKKPMLVGSNFNEAGLFRILAAESSVASTISDEEWAIFNLGIFQCPAGRAAAWRWQNFQPVWRYIYMGDFPNLELTKKPPSGAWHGAEIPIIWRTSEQYTGVRDTSQEEKISKYLHKAWARFAKEPTDAFFGDPFSWPDYDPGGECFESSA
jgi:cholinesterase